MNVFLTGAGGFIGRNLTARLRANEGVVVNLFDSDCSETDLCVGLETADVVYHLAGVNRSHTSKDFETVNAGLTQHICQILRGLRRIPTIVMASSIQVALDNPYGISKLHAEDALRDFSAQSGANIRIYRLKNVFGKWCRPNYNSVVATFCYNIARDLPIQISDPSRELELVYVDDVVEAFLAELPVQGGAHCHCEIPSSTLTLGDLVGRLQSFRDISTSLLIPDFGVRFNQQLYATYLSYLPDRSRMQTVKVTSDERGSLAEFIKSNHCGQIFISRTKPGITRGNHYHHTKTEKFLVVAGEGIIRMRQIDASDVVEYRVHGSFFQVVDIPPGYTHSIENTGAGDMVVLFWASEVFVPDRPDTYFLPVLDPIATSSR